MLDLTVPTGPAPGLLPAPVLPDAPSPLAVGITTSFLQRDLLELTRRIVAKLDSPEALALDMGLDHAQWAVLSQSEAFKAQMAAAQAEANSAAGLADRVRLKALTILDQGGLLDMAQIINNPAAPASARVTAFGAVTDVAGITKQKDQNASQAGSGPLVVINMPTAAGAPITIGGNVIEHAP